MANRGSTGSIHPLRRWRVANDFTQNDVAGLAGVSEPLISLIESGQRNPGPRTKVAIARALGVKVGEIFPAPRFQRKTRRVPRWKAER
jgi:transcriptional regulator with XRE-family HTH domain